MKALVLAAGRGERLRPLTDRIPKPLMDVGGRPLLDRHLDALAAAGFEEVVINTSHLAEQIHEFVGDGSRWGLRLALSHEPDGPLETGGGMLRALAHLDMDPFLAINADIVCDVDLGRLREHALAGLAHLVLVPNPGWKRGDFGLADGRVTGRSLEGYTFSGVGIYDPRLLDGQVDGKFSIVPILERAMARGLVTGELHDGLWLDIGTPERLRKAHEKIAAIG